MNETRRLIPAGFAFAANGEGRLQLPLRFPKHSLAHNGNPPGREPLEGRVVGSWRGM
jgi:hypothetical protein